MSEPLFKNVKRPYVRTVPADIPPHELPLCEKSWEDVLAMQALQRLTWQPPVNKEEREALIKIIEKGKLDHFITGGPKR